MAVHRSSCTALRIDSSAAVRAVLSFSRVTLHSKPHPVDIAFGMRALSAAAAANAACSLCSALHIYPIFGKWLFGCWLGLLHTHAQMSGMECCVPLGRGIFTLKPLNGEGGREGERICVANNGQPKCFGLSAIDRLLQNMHFGKISIFT